MYIASNYGDVRSQAGVTAAKSVCTGLHKQKQNEALEWGLKSEVMHEYSR